MGLSDEYIEELKSTPNVDTKINETADDYKEVLKEYNITNEDAASLFKVILDYKNDGIVEGLYNKLPQSAKKIADSFVIVGKSESIKVSKDNAAKTIIESFITDAKFSRSVDEFNEEMNKLAINTNKEYRLIMNEYIEGLYKDIDRIRKYKKVI